MKYFKLLISLVIASLIFVTVSVTGDDDYDNYSRPAKFIINSNTINDGLEPFTATIYGFGNSLFNKGGAFEPIVYRNAYIAEEDSPDKVILPASKISNWDSVKSGYLDGAEVRIYRITNNQFRLVRTDTIPEGGFNVSGWRSVLRKERILPADTTSLVYQWNEYGRPGSTQYFIVRAIDKSGKISKASAYLEFNRPKEIDEDYIAAKAIKLKSLEETKKSNLLSAPQDFKGTIDSRGNLVLNWSSVSSSDLAGYLVYRSDYAPPQHKGYFFALSQNPSSKEQHVKKGDMIIVNKKFYTGSRLKHASNRLWDTGTAYRMLVPSLLGHFSDDNPEVSWRLQKHDENTPVTEGGETYLQLDITDDRRVKIGDYNYSGTGQDWYPVLETKPYRVEVWLKSEKETDVRFKIKGFYEKNLEDNKPIVFKAGPKWQRHTATFKPARIQSGNIPSQMRLEIYGPGSFSIDNFRVYQADTEFMDYLPRDYEELEKSGVSALRAHSTIKTRTRTYDMEQLTNAGGVIDSTQHMNTLHQSLKMMKKAGVRPWVQIESHMSPEEWIGFVEYMAAPFNPETDSKEALPWAYKRVKQGQKKPWVDEFDKIYFEIANETWNGRFKPWVFPEMIDSANERYYARGEVYGLYQEYVISILRNSEHWQANNLDDKFSFVLGGWAANSNYGEYAASVSPSSDYLTIAGYNGGWDENEGPPKLNNESFSNLLNQVSQSAIPSTEKLQAIGKKLNEKRARKLGIGTYEAGPGYVLDGLNDEKVTEQQAKEQEEVMKSLSAGTATLDSFLARAYRGFDLQNFFTFGRGHRWRSHTEWYRGGYAHPSWKLISLFNKQATGDMLEVQTKSVPTTDLHKIRWRKAVDDAPLVAVYATRNADRYNVFVISRKVKNYPFQNDEGYSPVEINLPFNNVKSIELFKMDGDMRLNNFESENAKIEKMDIAIENFQPRFAVDDKTGADKMGLPPASTYLYVFKGAS